MKTINYYTKQTARVAVYFLMTLIAFAAAAQAAPTNDNFANAFQINVLSSGYIFGNSSATKEAGEPNHAGNTGGASVWFKWTAPDNHSMFVTTNRGGFDSLLAVYTGSSVNGLTLVAANDDIAGSTNSRSSVAFQAVQGTTYYIVVDGYTGEGQPPAQGTFIIDLAPALTRQAADYDHDGKTDFSVFRPSNGGWYVYGSATNASRGSQFGQQGDLPVPADYSGDGRTDTAVYRTSNHTWYILDSFTNQFRAAQFGADNDILVPGDYTGDGKADIAVFRPSNGVWYILDLQTNQFTYRQFGQQGDVPAPADFDPDNRTDLAVFRPSNGTWYVLRSASNTTIQQQFGASEDVPVAGDYDADGRADIAVYRPLMGSWYVLRSSDNKLQAAQFGQSGDFPTVGDFDGDRKFDYAVFRSDTWYYLSSLSGTVHGMAYGTFGDYPVTAVLAEVDHF